MKKSLFPAVLLLSLSLLGFVSCESTGAIADTLLDISEIESYTDDKKLAAALRASAKTTKALEDITPEEEYYIGRAVAATVLTNYKVYNNKAKESYANKICRVITINSENPDCYNGYHVKLLDTDEINAYATSSGIIFITRGLYEVVESEDQLAAVIAHEVGHILLKHSTSIIKSSRWTDATTATTSAVLVSLSDNEKKMKLSTAMGGMIEDVSSVLITKGYSKTQEYDADTKALSLLAEAGYNPNALIQMLEILDSLEGNNNTGMFQTHPSPRNRIKNANYEIEDLEVEIPEDTSKFRKTRFISK